MSYSCLFVVGGAQVQLNTDEYNANEYLEITQFAH